MLANASRARLKRTENSIREGWKQCLSDGTVSSAGLEVGHTEVVGLLDSSRREIEELFSPAEVETHLYDFDAWWNALVQPGTNWTAASTNPIMEPHLFRSLTKTADLVDHRLSLPTDAALAEFRERLAALRDEADTMDLADEVRVRVVKDLDDILAALDDPAVPGRSVVKRANEKAGAYIVEALRDPERLAPLLYFGGALTVVVYILTGHAVDVGMALTGLRGYTAVMGSTVMEQLDRALGAQKAIESGPSGKPREVESGKNDEDDDEAAADE